MNSDCGCDGYSLKQAQQLVGLSAAMLEYLCRLRIVVPSHVPCRGRGRARRYSFGDLVLLRVISRLLSNGISVTRMRVALRAIQKRYSNLSSALKSSVLVTDGRAVYLLDKRGALEDVRFGQMAFAFMIELSSIEADLSEKTKRFDRLNSRQSQVERRRA